MMQILFSTPLALKQTVRKGRKWVQLDTSLNTHKTCGTPVKVASPVSNTEVHHAENPYLTMLFLVMNNFIMCVKE